MAANPDPSRITAELWWLWEQLRDLEPGTKLGGIYANTNGYHDTRNNLRRRLPGNYSIQDPEDKGGPGDKAAAIDWTFPDAQRGDYRRIALYCDRLMASSKDMQDDRLNGWREWYGQTDTDREVEGWDSRYVRPASSDLSHLWHIHMSCDRDKVEDMRTMRAMLSVLRGETYAQWLATDQGDDDMPSLNEIEDAAYRGAMRAEREYNETARGWWDGVDAPPIQMWHQTWHWARLTYEGGTVREIRDEIVKFLDGVDVHVDVDKLEAAVRSGVGKALTSAGQAINPPEASG
jgi:hypothetical protein